MAGTSPAIRCAWEDGSSAPWGIPVVLNIAIIAVIEAYAGIGIINYELIADIHDVSPGVFRIARLNGRRGGCTQQDEENQLCHDTPP
jgi:hypothetical protein